MAGSAAWLQGPCGHGASSNAEIEGAKLGGVRARDGGQEWRADELAVTGGRWEMKDRREVLEFSNYGFFYNI